MNQAWMDFLNENDEELLSDPFLRQKVLEHDEILLKARPDIAFEQRCNMVARYVRERYGSATQRVIHEMAKQRGPRGMQTEDDELGNEAGGTAIDDEITADRHAAIHGMALARRGQEVKLNKERYNEMELRRRQNNRN